MCSKRHVQQGGHAEASRYGWIVQHVHLVIVCEGRVRGTIGASGMDFTMPAGCVEGRICGAAVVACPGLVGDVGGGGWGGRG